MVISNLRGVAAAFLLLTALSTVQAQSYTKPMVRGIAGFVRVDASNYRHEIQEALSVLRTAKSEFEKEGYQVWTLRIVTQPFPELVAGQSDEEAIAFIRTLSELSSRENFMLNVGPAMMSDADDPHFMRLLARVLSTFPNIEASAILAGNRGINWKVVRESASLLRYVVDHSPQERATDQFAASALLGPYSPFYPGAYHAGPGKQFSIGFQSANVVQEVFQRTHGDFDASVKELTAQLTVHAKVAESIGMRVSTARGWAFAGVDPTPAPLGDVSIGAAIETYSGVKFGASGTLTAALIVTTAVKAVPVKQVGYSGLMMPVMEDKLLAERWAQGTFNVGSLLAFSSVCGTGLVTIPLPGDISSGQLERIFSDVASLAWKWNKPLLAKLMPIRGKKVGDRTNWDGNYLSNTTVQPAP